MFRWIVMSALLISTAAPAGDAVAPENSGTPLDKAATVEAGDIAATQVTLFFATGIAKQEFDAPVLAQYDRSSKRLVITIVGGRSNVEGARKSLDDFRKLLVPFSENILQKVNGIRLSDSNTTIIYYARSGYGETAQLKEILRREAGKFITP